jgi:hypothetical protein
MFLAIRFITALRRLTILGAVLIGRGHSEFSNAKPPPRHTRHRVGGKLTATGHQRTAG